MTQCDGPKPLRILNAEPLGYSCEARALLMQWGTLVEKEMCRTELLHELGDYDVLIVRLAHQIDQEVIKVGQHLKAIVTATTGLDHIDVEFAQARGIAVLSLRGETEFLRSICATAEHTWALLLGLLRRIVPAFLAVQRGEWDRDAFRGHELNGKRLGIIGLGRVGQKVARYGQIFGMEVKAYDPFAPEWIEGVWRAATLADLLCWSNVLSLHVPLTTETQGMIGTSELALLPPGAIFINTSRGELVDEAALAQVLASQHLAGAAVDVIGHERQPEQRRQSPLLAYACSHDNLLITPHIAGATYESMAKTEVFIARKLENFLAHLGLLTHCDTRSIRTHA